MLGWSHAGQSVTRIPRYSIVRCRADWSVTRIPTLQHTSARWRCVLWSFRLFAAGEGYPHFTMTLPVCR